MDVADIDDQFDQFTSLIKDNDKLIKKHYCKSGLPKWIKVDEFYDHLRKDLFTIIKDAVKDPLHPNSYNC